MTRFDEDGSNELNFEEFYHLAKFQLGLNKKSWYRSIWFRVINKWALKGPPDIESTFPYSRGNSLLVLPRSMHLFSYRLQR
jgi:hypothetical protein